MRAPRVTVEPTAGEWSRYVTEAVRVGLSVPEWLRAAANEAVLRAELGLRRHEPSAGPGRCPICGQLLRAAAGPGRPAVYCTARCRRTAWRRRRRRETRG